MANTYYDSDLTGEQIEQALEAIDGVIDPANNGKVLAINNGKIEARSVQWDADLGPKSITENGTYNPASDNLDGYSQVTVNVSGGGGTTDANHVTYNSSETYDSGTVGAALNEQRNTLNQLDQNMAYVESSNTASRTYSAGAYISWKGTLYTASTAIPLGDPFAVGTNLAAVVDGNGNLCGGLNSLKDSVPKLVDFKVYPSQYTWNGISGYWWVQGITIPNVTISKILSIIPSAINTGDTYRYFSYIDDDNKIGQNWTENSNNPGTLASDKYLQLRVLYI